MAALSLSVTAKAVPGNFLAVAGGRGDENRRQRELAFYTMVSLTNAGSKGKESAWRV